MPDLISDAQAVLLWGEMRIPLAIAALLSAVSTSRTTPPDELRELLARAGNYAQQYHAEFTTIVAEEHYVQRLSSRVRTGAATTGVAQGAEPPAQRTLRSDFMLIRGVAAEDAWFAFRDVLEVDGQAVSGTRGRLEEWLRDSSASFMQRARGLALEQARYNLGDIVRTINTPLMPLEFLLPRNQKRFRFRAAGNMPVGTVVAIVLSYEERERPTIIRTPDGADVPASGRLWIDPDTGRVLIAELKAGGREGRHVRAGITVTYAHHERLNMLVPVEMDDTYASGTTEISGRATYSNFRRFETGARLVR